MESKSSQVLFSRASWMCSVTATGNCFLADAQKFVCWDSSRSIQPVAYLMQHVISSCVRLQKSRIQKRQKLHSIPNLELTYFNHRGNWGIVWESGKRTLTIVTFCCHWKWWDTMFWMLSTDTETCTAFSRGNSNLIRLPVVESDQPTEINAHER